MARYFLLRVGSGHPPIMRKPKAHKLLESFMDETQRQDLKKHGYFFVVGSDKRVYALGDGKQVIIMRNGKPVSHRNVWGMGEERYGSLLTQLVWLRANAPGLLCNGCTDGGWLPHYQRLFAHARL